MNPRNESSSLFQTKYSGRIQNLLEHYLGFTKSSSRLNEALAYSVLNGGKRFRPLLIYATGLDLKVAPEALDAAAVAIELIHCYSLVHDDLPAMDNDDLRRGKATNHIVFDEATAILTGDALQSLAFEILSNKNPHLNAETQIKMMHCLSLAAGAMAAGQMLDLQSEGQKLNLNEIENIHRLKTGAIISACFELASLAAECSATQLEELRKIGFALGLAFQIQDDILDIEGATETLGKKAGSDEALDKSTYPKLLGLAAAKLKFQEEYTEVKTFIQKTIPEATYLNGMVEQLLGRKY